MAIIDFFDRGWQIDPNAAAYVMDEQVFTFEEVGTLSCRIANALLAAGMGRGKIGAVLGANHPTAWTCTLGLWRAGMAWMPVNPRGSTEENQQLLDGFDCEVLFFQKAFAPVVEAMRPKLPKVRLYVCIEEAAPGASGLPDWTAAQPANRPEVSYEPDDTIAVMPTGGTTGLPKGVMNTHRSFQAFCAQFMIACSYRADEKIVNLAAAPMTHTAGVLSLPCTARGGTVVVLTKPDPAALVEAIEKHRVSEFFLPPTVIYRLLDMPGIGEHDYSSLKYFICGAAPMSAEKLRRAMAVFGPVMMEAYGQTEAPGSIAIKRPEENFSGGEIADEARLLSCGRPGPLVRVVIMNARNEPLATGETGEICVRGDLVMKGYYKAPEKTAEAIIDGWLHTGDIGHIDADGYLRITDRKKDMVITGGFNVYPSEVEQVIWTHPAVQDCAVIGVPDATWGEAVKAVVELNPGMDVSGEELIALCKERLGSVKAPKSVDFVATLPRSPNGKVLKKDLRTPYWTAQNRSI
ncbi:class I adenylate-forming enzyme family protein [Cupriavidus taiwanensis]|uniref:Acyl-CoA synthetase (AMP-forming)/AMP-acid ligase II n=1 Tax=Cupriavidus taiwanensis TaxID=164546 RepID=A0A375JBB5_9BURK|nr:AMP-binding protein [Cupriavidus taiwanensis]SPS02398.1 Acyl-CoA synthetase (AMP-forming)/AMP-acid ligase II [Cupriavidus taiwanensis]